MAIYAYFQRILIYSVSLTVMCVFFSMMDRTKRLHQPDLPPKRVYDFDVRRSLPLHALKRMKDYLKYTDFKDFVSLVNISKSVIRMRKVNTDVRVGDDIIVDIDLYNGRGERSTVGGDMLRVWLRDHSLRTSVSGYVIDHGNGTYTGIVKAMWSGNPELMFSISNTKEHVGIYMNSVLKYGLILFLKAKFKKENFTENTLCSVVPNIPDVKEYCNFTSENYNMSYFCGKPKTMACTDWSGCERSMVYSCNEKHKSLFQTYKHIKKHVSTLKVLPGSGSTDNPNVFCHAVNSTTTWQTTVPTGYFYKGQWRSLICKPSLQWKYEAYLKCLKNRPVLMTGDSTTRNWFAFLAKLLKLRIFVGHTEIRNKAWYELPKAWYAFSEAEHKTKSISMYWTRHELPFFTAPAAGELKKDSRSVASRIDDLPGNKSAVVLLHWFTHLTRTTPQQYRIHVQSVKSALIRLLRRSPHSSVFLKGPHSFTHMDYPAPFDYISRMYEQILYEEFKDLQDKMYYIDQWDATVGNENVNVHPNPSFDTVMLNYLFSFIC